MRFLYLSCAALIIALTGWFLLQDASAAALTQRAADAFDGRPARTVLFVGNSRTYYHDMPAMLRSIADSAASPTKFEVESSSYADATFESQWATVRTRHLLDEQWNDVILQGESRGQSSDDLDRAFQKYGKLLGQAAAAHGARVRLLVNWAYDPAAYTDDPDGTGRAEHLELIRASHRRLASAASLHAINTAGVWESVRQKYPAIRLTEDGNHPTAAGSYLIALTIYADLSGASVKNVTYVPDDVTAEDATRLRTAVVDFAL